ncbi:35603_t:CDS:1, partial [Gigaspora margarita]
NLPKWEFTNHKQRYQACQAAQKSLEKCQTISCNKTITEIQALLLDLNQEQLDNIYKRLIELSKNEIINNKEQESSHDNRISKEKFQKKNNLFNSTTT